MKFSRFDGKQKAIMVKESGSKSKLNLRKRPLLKHDVPRPKMKVSNIFSSSQWQRVQRLVKVRCRKPNGEA